MLNVSRLLASGEHLPFKIKIKRYDEHELMVLNYETFERERNHPVVVECRGLILHSHTYNVVSRSFDRFFNLQELVDTHAHQRLYNAKEKFKFYEKIDGSLIKLYYYNDQWHASTRGSAFAENQCAVGLTFKSVILQALNLLTENEFQSLCDCYLDRAFTHMFELTSGHNRIVTVYDHAPALWYLASRKNATADYIYCNNLPFCKYPKCYEFASVLQCVKMASKLQNLEEGFVVYEENGAPLCKIKSEEYLRLHKSQSRTESPAKLAQLVLNGEHDDFLAQFSHLKKCVQPYINARNLFSDKSTVDKMNSGLAMDQHAFNKLVCNLPWKNLAYKCRKAQTTDVEAEFLKLTEAEQIRMIKNIVNPKPVKQKADTAAPVKQLLLLIGICGSGKSTFAKKLKNYLEINRDDMRVKLFLNGDYTKLNAFYTQPRKCRRSKENQVTNACVKLFEEAARDGLNVVVSDTNLNSTATETWQQLAAKHQYEYKTQFMNVSLETALERNFSRSDKFPVNPEIVKRQYKKFLSLIGFERYTPPGDKFPNAVLCDLDGTVALPTNRSFYDFDERVFEDAPRTDVIACVQHLANVHNAVVVFMTGRSIVCEPSTRRWIDAHVKLDSYNLFMRPLGDHCKDSLLKLTLFNKYVRGQFNVVAVFDDRPCVVRTWQDLQIPNVFNVCRDYLEF
ncbi:polynucleotide kinase/ligase [Anticarsia gemmatalis multiple nucleopolyhedrovirus]|uniref:Polynucleotide kinase/ligase n=1 Tax=Anticarsia gemmatalis multiple nucleopolyhedrovirus TaxID=268591 RepID=A0A0S3IZ21_9ABAC|nr:polynucleotide kinase/ligase [Anticarsia gemmatalis multiple nucleopolyhedrovirus]ALR70179.1 polynucleotide kinase/ligase [Anticarsia gemmatalis multiple nucleopolyhedrovirus]ALR70806.1 polynucleotide kinase/ligase [Anticarsia gemmatalis multiple nucleopolyhedrovirus]ALR71279.1 polynucleotide kinase/ligase [Anticarsia gemmatalis multiple nucleopolyhedrovirus]ALR71437.1 polynucleotide kinase/ligase [Anticarsia gemmatalis multiple nucleopolyhedrovirus]ALR71593.1 polynucleotide kinase/ligase [